MAKTIEQLHLEEQKIEEQITQERHKQQRLENRIGYYEKGDRRKREHHLITRGASVESAAPLHSPWWS